MNKTKILLNFTTFHYGLDVSFEKVFVINTKKRPLNQSTDTYLMHKCMWSVIVREGERKTFDLIFLFLYDNYEGVTDYYIYLFFIS